MIVWGFPAGRFVCLVRFGQLLMCARTDIIHKLEIASLVPLERAKLFRKKIVHYVHQFIESQRKF